MKKSFTNHVLKDVAFLEEQNNISYRQNILFQEEQVEKELNYQEAVNDAMRILRV